MSVPVVNVRDSCRGCGSREIVGCVPLAPVPIVSPNVSPTAEISKSEGVVAPLDTYLCRDCGLIQLVHVVDPALLYRQYLYRTSISTGLPEHFQALAEKLVEEQSLGPNAFVVEFGSNDGTFLQAFKQLGMRVLGVEPASAIAAAAEARGVPTLEAFFGEQLAQKIVADSGQAELVVANNVFANIDDLDDVVRGLKTLLSKQGAFVFETQYALDVFERFLLDVIYHEHLSTFSVRSTKALFERFDMELFDAKRIETKGGSIRIWVQHRGGPHPIAARVGDLIKLEHESGLFDPARLSRFSDRVETTRDALLRIVDGVRGKGGTVAAYGTSVGCAALIHHFDLTSRLSFFLDDTPFKDELRGPGYRLPVFSGDGVVQHDPDLIIILAWRYADAIVSKHQAYLRGKGRFVIPLPEVHQVPQPVDAFAPAMP